MHATPSSAMGSVAGKKARRPNSRRPATISQQETTNSVFSLASKMRDTDAVVAAGRISSTIHSTSSSEPTRVAAADGEALPGRAAGSCDSLLIGFGFPVRGPAFKPPGRRSARIDEAPR